MIIAAIAGAFFAGISCAAEREPPPGTYQVVDGRVDQGTYEGWLTYHTACHICHGPDAIGSDIAPNLRYSLKAMTQSEFANKVLTRYRIFIGPTDSMSSEAWRQSVLDEVIRQRRGQRGTVAMPAWQSNPGIKPHVLDLFAYLKARSDEAIGPGRPQVKGER
ncbi:MAG: hypothetical protein ACKVQA_19235 [Burkholderiales bacterium]